MESFFSGWRIPEKKDKAYRPLSFCSLCTTTSSKKQKHFSLKMFITILSDWPGQFPKSCLWSPGRALIDFCFVEGPDNWWWFRWWGQEWWPDLMGSLSLPELVVQQADALLDLPHLLHQPRGGQHRQQHVHYHGSSPSSYPWWGLSLHASTSGLDALKVIV